MIKSSEAYQEAIVSDGRRMYVKAVVDIEDPDMVQGAVSGSEQEPGISRPMQLWDKEFSLNANYASMEPNRWILDGRTQLRTGDSATRNWEAGYVGAMLSGEGGVFPVPQWTEIAFSNVGLLQACTVAFSDRPTDGIAADFTVEVFIDGVVYHTATVTGNTEALVVLRGFRVAHPDEIRVTVTRWSLPGRRMRVAEIVPGIYEVWKGDEMCELSVKHQGDPSCLTLPYGTAYIKMDNLDRRFDPRTKDGIFLMIEERQGIELYMGPGLPDGAVEYKPLGVFYQSGRGWCTGDNSMTMGWDLVDIIGLLARRTFQPKEKELPTTLKGWMAALVGQLGENFENRVRVDPAYADLPITAKQADIEGMECGEILRLVCMTAGVWPRADASTGYLAAEPLWNQGNKITLDNLNKYPTMSANEDVASITINGHTTDGTSPSCGDTVEEENPFLPDEKWTECARAMLSFYGGNKLELLGRGDPSSEIGDVDTVWLADGNATTARRIKQEFTISDGVPKNCSSTLIRGDGVFLFTNREQILKTGTWTVPDGVYRLRVVLVGAGSPGTPGGCHGNGWSTYKPGIGFVGSKPYPGTPGKGGKIWNGVIDVNPGQVIQVTLKGYTKLWNYSSADGEEYPNGFTDIATGDVYGRTGVGNSKPGSGDGGGAGGGGTPGYWYTQGVWVTDAGEEIVAPETRPVGTVGTGHWESRVVIVSEPKPGSSGGGGASGSAIIYWDNPEVVEA